MAVDYFQCDECGEWGCCVIDLDGQTHTVERHVAPDDLPVMFKRWRGESATFNEERMTRVAAEGRLKSQQVCGTWIRTPLKDLISQKPKGKTYAE